MKRRLNVIRWIVLLGAVSSLIAAAVAFIVGGVEVAHIVVTLTTQKLSEVPSSIHLVQLMDTLLIGAALFLFAAGLHELFIGPLEMPPALVITSFDDLESKLAGVIVLVLAVEFLQHFEAWEDGLQTLEHAVAAALISAALLMLVRTHK